METKPIEIAIYIPDADAAKWLLFQQHYEPFSIMAERQVFEQKNATVSLDFDRYGKLQAIRRNDFLYSVKEAKYVDTRP